MNRHELTDSQWELLAPFFPPRPRRRGGQWKDDRTILNGLSCRLNTAAPGRDLPERYGPGKTVYHRFNQLRKSGLLDQILQALQVRLDEEGRIDYDFWCIDASPVRASRVAAGAAKKSSRGASRSRLGSLSRRIWHENPLGYRRSRTAVGGETLSWPAA